jgi:hypothetical protein
MATTNLTSIKANALTNVVSTIISTTNIIPSSVPKISSIDYPGDDTAASVDGGQTITINGSGFSSGATVLINGSYAGVVTVVDSTTITFTSPANNSGTYPLYVINTDGGTAISVPGISYSGTPSWSTSAGSIATLYETAAASNTVTATGDGTISYSLYSGTLPPGSSLNTSTGLISGTTQATDSSTTYNFTIRATDSENQDTDRAFSITINPDVVTWSSPADGSTTTLSANVSMTPVTLSASSAAGKSISYSANALPTGVTLSSDTISGTPTVVGNTTSVITATAAVTNRTSSRTFYWEVTAATDTYWKNTVLLLNGETSSTTFINDASGNNTSLIVVGQPVATKFNPYQNGYYSNYFDGSGDYLTVADNSAFEISGDFTVEAWFYATALPSAGNYGDIVTKGASGIYQPYYFFVNSSGALLFYSSSNGSSWDVSSATNLGTVSVNRWYHVAVSRQGTALRLFLDGSLITTITNGSSLYNNSTAVAVGARSDGTETFSGYISNVRIVNGSAVYTSAFTPPTTPLTAITNTSLLICQSNRLIDKSSNAFTVTKNGDVTVTQVQPFAVSNDYGGAYFASTSDYTQYTGSTAQVFGTGDFTVECWIYATNPGSTTGHNISRPGTLTNTWSLQTYNNAMAWLFGSTTLGTGAIPVNAWSHLCVSRVSGVTKGFVNGVQVFSVSDTNNYSASPTRPIGPGAGGSAVFYLSDFRVVVGSGVTSVTVPTEPRATDSNTKLLTHQYKDNVTNQNVYDSGMFNHIITRYGNASATSFSPYSPTGWSNYFDGSGDYLSVPTSGNQLDATGDFTTEMWIYWNSMPTTGYQNISGQGAAGQNSYGLLAGNASSDTWSAPYKFKLNIANVGDVLNGDTTLVAGQWYHLAHTRTSGVNRLFVNGVLQTNTYTDSTSRGFAGNPFTIGNNSNCFISNFRYIKGTSLYTTTFTPPTSTLTAVANTQLLTCQSNRFIDNSTNSLTITKNGDTSVQSFSPFSSGTSYSPSTHSGSIYLDGSGDYLTLPTSQAFGFGSGDFTVDFWVYPLATSRQDWLDITDGTTRVLIYYSGSAITFYTVPNNAAAITGPALVTKQWYHIALSKNGVNTKLFVNGLQVGTTYGTNQTYGTTLPITIGKDSAGSTYVTGYISDVRVTKGLAIYTANTTPPTAAVSNYSINYPASSLLRFEGGMLDKHSSIGFETLNNAQLSTAVKKYGKSSMYFDGNGDRLVIPYTPLLSQTGPYTVEFWFYPTNSYSGQYLFGRNAGNYFNIAWNGSVLLVDKHGVGIQITGSTTISLNTWNHCAMTYDGTNTKLWVNGVLDGSVSGTGGESSAVTTIGYYEASGTSSFYGYIDDFRFTKGVARYSSNFTPPEELKVK